MHAVCCAYVKYDVMTPVMGFLSGGTFEWGGWVVFVPLLGNQDLSLLLHCYWLLENEVDSTVRTLLKRVYQMHF